MSESAKKPKRKKDAKEPRHESLRAEFGGDNATPEPAYGEARLWTTARDPRSIFVYWAFNPSEHPETRGKDGASWFFVRVLRDEGSVDATVEIQPEAGNCFIPVSRPDCGYFAELGFFSEGVWCFLARSGNTRTPPENVASGETAQFATIPAKISLTEFRRLLAESALPGEGIAETAARLRAVAGTQYGWTEEQERLMALVLGEQSESALAAGASSADLTRRMARRLGGENDTAEVPEAWEGAGVGSPGASWMGASWAGSPGASWRVAPGRGFFLHVNAEVIFYGGTDPAATLTVNGEAVDVRRDGTFRFHFRLPDGEFEVPIVARSPDGQETRSATIRFARATTRTGDVGATAQPDFLPSMIGGKG